MYVHKKFRPFYWTRQAAPALTSVLESECQSLTALGNKSLFLDEIMRVTHVS